MRVPSILGVLVVLATTPAIALDPTVAISQYGHRSWQADAGLPQATVQGIAQTPDGYLWLATQNGLVRFDGVRFVVFDAANTPELGKHYLWSLATDRAGALWIGTSDGLVVYRNGRFQREKVREILGGAMLALHPARDGSVWSASARALVRRDPQGRYTSIPVPEGHIESLAEDRRGNLWIGRQGDLLRRSSDGRITTFTTKNGLPHNGITRIYEDRRGNIWVGTLGGLARYADAGFVSEGPVAKLLGTSVRTILEDSDANLWIGTDSGLRRISRGRIDSFSETDGLSGPTVRSLFEDRENNLWVGTYTGGLNQFRDVPFTTYGKRNGLSSDVILSVLQDREGGIWVGTDGGGVCRMKDGSTRCFTKSDGLPNSVVWGLAEARDGAIWIGTSGGGLARYHHGRLTTEYTTKNGLNSDVVNNILVDGDRLWIGMIGGGVSVLENGRITHYDEKRGVPNHRTVLMLEHAMGGGVWVGMPGAHLLRVKNGRGDREALPFAPAIPRAVIEDSDGTKWIGSTGEGLIRIRNGKVVHFRVANGMFDDDVHEVIDDGYGYLWLTSNTGLTRVSRMELNAFADGRSARIRGRFFQMADGLPANELNGGSPGRYRTADGTLWFPTIKGLVSVHPSKVYARSIAPPVVIEQAVADGTILRGQMPSVPAGTERLVMSYTGINLRNPSRTRFRYKLEGFDGDWVDAGTARTATYTNLPPGRYRFRVGARSGDGVWSESASSYAFTKEPALHETYWFRGLALTSILGAILLIFRLRLRTLRARERHLAELVEKRTALLAEANESLKRMSLTDPLTGVANRRRFTEHLESEWRRASRDGSPLSLLMLDVDYFKKFNDTYGHHDGDECLMRVAQAAAQCVGRPADLLARYGGEEFAVVVAGDEEAALHIGEAMRASVERLLLPHAGSDAASHVTISVGAARRSESTESISELIEAADRALYLSKKAGRNRVTLTAEVPLSVAA